MSNTKISYQIKNICIFYIWKASKCEIVLLKWTWTHISLHKEGQILWVVSNVLWCRYILQRRKYNIWRCSIGHRTKLLLVCRKIILLFQRIPSFYFYIIFWHWFLDMDRFFPFLSWQMINAFFIVVMNTRRLKITMFF